MKKNILCFSLFLIISNSAIADNFVFRYPYLYKKEIKEEDKEYTEDEKKETWAKFADENGLSYDEDWTSIYWSDSNLKRLPSVPYPNNRAEYIFLSNNDISDFSSLSSLKEIKMLMIKDNSEIRGFDGYSISTTGFHLQGSSNISGFNSNIRVYDAEDEVYQSIFLSNTQNVSGFNGGNIEASFIDLRNSYGISGFNRGTVKSDSIDLDGSQNISGFNDGIIKAKFINLNNSHHISGFNSKIIVYDPEDDEYKSIKLEYAEDISGFNGETIKASFINLNNAKNVSGFNGISTFNGSLGLSNTTLKGAFNSLEYFNSNDLNGINLSNGVINSSFKNLKNIKGQIYISDSVISGESLMNIEKVSGDIYIINNNLNNLNMFSKLREANIIISDNNPLKDISGLSNIKSVNAISLGTMSSDKVVFEKKIDKDAWLCQPEQRNVFDIYDQSEVCE